MIPYRTGSLHCFVLMKSAATRGENEDDDGVDYDARGVDDRDDDEGYAADNDGEEDGGMAVVVIVAKNS